MFLLYTLVSCIPLVFVAEGRTVQGMIGRNVSLLWTFNNIKKDSISISRNSIHLLMVWPLKNLIVWHEKDDRLHVYVDNSSYETLTVTVSISGLREKDAGIYKLKRRWDSEDFNDSVRLQIYRKVSWKLNGTLIESHGRYSQNNALLSIKNVTANDKYNIYTCNELGSGFNSDPYRLNISGPNVVKFVSNVTVAKEHEGLHLFCDTYCYPTCTWHWTQVDNLSAAKKVVSEGDELKINNVTREDAGKYSCKVNNVITGASFEGFTYLEVVYGPDEIYTNASDNIIQVNESETISVFCYSDCFPPCQFVWIVTNTNAPIRGAELKLESVTVDINYTCYATNLMNAKASNSITIYIKVRPGVRVFTTTTITPVNNTGSYYFFPRIFILRCVQGKDVSVTRGDVTESTNFAN
ncbi:hypothetical protein CHS0354_014892 [Potamilus streckersoni]|uniref:Ig-like domain-containing protein n=1 Tax=Potamilus streckersoni TaxID=2493646 RepID=A0AAE0RU39_9BIVA|nr:hypothetical protein CHS0354_014892 [Potamilus streckersoni]